MNTIYRNSSQILKTKLYISEAICFFLRCVVLPTDASET
jgi:hypothetical protein